jgi:hypothetical protein
MIAGLGLWYSASDPAYDAFTYEQAIPTLFDASGNGWNAAQATGSNQARFLTHDGENYLRNPGIAGNTVSTPSSVGINAVTGDATWEVYDLAFASWTPASNTELFWKNDTGTNNRQFIFRLLTSGQLDLILSSNGTSQGSIASGVAVSGSAWVPLAVKCTYRASDQLTSFYTSTNRGASWTLLGSGTHSRTSIFQGTAPLVVGSVTTSFKCSRAVFRNGIDGVAVADFDPSRGNFNSATIGSATGETWTINKSGLNPAMIVSARAFLPLTNDFYDISASAADVLRNVSGGTMVLARLVTSLATDQNAMAISSGTVADQNRAVLDATTAGLWRVGGRRVDGTSFETVTAAGAAVNNMVVQCGRLNYASALAANFINGSLVGSESAFQTAGNTSDTASLRMRVFSNANTVASGFTSGPVTDLCLYNRALTNAQIFSLSRYFAGRTGGAVTV